MHPTATFGVLAFRALCLLIPMPCGGFGILLQRGRGCVRLGCHPWGGPSSPVEVQHPVPPRTGEGVSIRTTGPHRG